jgi:hypothetical protein
MNDENLIPALIGFALVWILARLFRRFVLSKIYAWLDRREEENAIREELRGYIAATEWLEDCVYTYEELDAYS